jgi:hypothetical protein
MNPFDKLDAGFSSNRPTLAALLGQTHRLVRRFVVIGEHELVAISLWNAHTYVFDCSRVSPYLHAHSPEPQSGKTTLLEVLELTARYAVSADGMSEAALFRMIAKEKPTLLLDEVDAIFGKKNSDSTEGIRQVLNSGYKKGKKVWRCVPPAHDVAPFDVYGPKALAGLHELPGTLASRAVPIAMRPPLPTDAWDDLDPEEVDGEAEILRRNLESWAEEAEGVLRDPRLKPARLRGLDARANEIWRILFRIADLAGGDWPERARAAAVALSGRGRRQRDLSTSLRLLGQIRDLFPAERVSCSALVEALNADEQIPYGDWNDGKGISTRELGRKLEPYGIRAKPIRIDGERAGNGYSREQFEDVWARYLPATDLSNRYTGTTGYQSQKSGASNRYNDPDVPVSENGANPHAQRDVPVVPVLDAENGTAPPDDDFVQDLIDTFDAVEVDPETEKCLTCSARVPLGEGRCAVCREHVPHPPPPGWPGWRER